MNRSAIVLVNGLFRTEFAKTTHGLVRGPRRFPLAGLVDPENAGHDAGELLDGKHRGIPIYASVEELLAAVPEKPTDCLVGVATHGGILPDPLKGELLNAARHGMRLVNGLHHPLSADPDLARAAADGGGGILDFRKPKAPADLRFWTGEIYSIDIPRIPVIGTDCAVGKRTTATFLMQRCRERGLVAEMIYTGQTGWLQGHKHGFIFDATLNDFVCGELEGAILECARETEPQVMFIEGQSSLRNPAGPAGSELIVSGAAHGVIVQHDPGREHYLDLEELDCRIPTLASELEMVRLLGSETWVVTLNTSRTDPGKALEIRDRYEEELGVPVVVPLVEGVDRIVEVVAARCGLSLSPVEDAS